MKKLILLTSICILGATVLSFTVKKNSTSFNNEVVYLGGRNAAGQNTVNANQISPLLNTAAYHDVQNKLVITPGTGIGVAFNSDSTNITVTNTGMASSPTFNTAVSRTLNSNYTISTTKNTRVYYSVRIAYNITVLLGSTGAISLQYSTNGGSTWVTVQTVSNSLNLGLALTGYNDFGLSGEIPANALVRLNSTTTNATNSYTSGTEILY